MAIELYLNADADARVRAAWSRLDASGIRSLGTSGNAEYHPHVSLAVFDDIEPSVIAASCRSVLRPEDDVPLTLSALGFFLSDEAPAFLAVTPSRKLLDLHVRVVDAIRRAVTGLWPYYEPDGLFFHCTLAMDVSDRAAVVRALDDLELPIVATGGGLHLVDVLTGKSVLDLWPDGVPG